VISPAGRLAVAAPDLVVAMTARRAAVGLVVVQVSDQAEQLGGVAADGMDVVLDDPDG
jgi:hypothetical protein